MRKNQFKYNVKQGQKFSRLTVIAESTSGSKNRKRMVLCECACGKRKTIDIYSLYDGNTQSCGCLQSEVAAKYSSLACTTHGESHGKKRTPEYAAWVKMKERCYWKASNRYYRYGARGIKVCDRWLNSYENFLKDMGRKPSKTHSLDRINSNGNYDPLNCKWSTNKEQMRNTSRNKFIQILECSKTIGEWCEIYKKSHSLVYGRLKRNWSVERAIFTPVKEKYRNGNYIKR